METGLSGLLYPGLERRLYSLIGGNPHLSWNSINNSGYHVPLQPNLLAREAIFNDLYPNYFILIISLTITRLATSDRLTLLYLLIRSLTQSGKPIRDVGQRVSCELHKKI